MSSTSNVENLAPHVIRRVAKELAELVSQPPEGIKVIPNEEDVSDIQAVVEGPAGTPYHNGQFRVKLVLGKSFPSAPPKGFFLTKIFHPNVSRSGEICVNTLKKDWKEDLGLKHILLVIKCLLIVPNAESALNEEAAKMLLEHYDDYCKRAKMITEIHAKPVLASNQNKNVENGGLENRSANGQQQQQQQSPQKGGGGNRKHLGEDAIGGGGNGGGGPLLKKLASNSNNLRSSKLAVNNGGKPTTATVDCKKKRALKRL